MAIGMKLEMTGDKLLKAQLADLSDRGARGAMGSGIKAALGKIAAALRAAVNASPASAELKAAARRTVGERFVGGRGRAVQAKVGYAVAKTGRGVGVDARNIHWFVLGATGEKPRKGQMGPPRKTSTGAERGVIQAVFAGTAQAALATGAGPALAAARKAIHEAILKRMKGR